MFLPAADQAGGDDEPEGGRSVHDDLPLPVPPGKTQAWCSSPTQGQPQQVSTWGALWC